MKIKIKGNKREEIRVCENCGAPLIWTLRWDYKERYCLNCGGLGDMFLGEDAELTPKLKIEYKIVKGIWDSLYGNGKPLLPESERYKKDKCKNCDAGEYHGQHLTEEEKLGNEIAEKVLDNLEYFLTS